MEKRQPFCNNCTSENIHGTCFEVTWDWKSQKWLPSGDLEEIRCDDCEANVSDVQWRDSPGRAGATDYTDEYPLLVGDQWETAMDTLGHNCTSHLNEQGDCPRCDEIDRILDEKRADPDKHFWTPVIQEIHQWKKR